MSEPGRQALRLHVTLDRRINFAMQQNDVPVVKSITVENVGDDTARDLEVRLRTEPEFGNPWAARIAAIASGASYALTAIDFQVLPGFIGQLTERLRGQITFEVLQGDQVFAKQTESVELLARDEWGGSGSLPEILAAFCLPNHPFVARILAQASKLLHEWTGDPSLSGYQTKDPARVRLMAGAIYGALQTLNLTYINPPAAFESAGQRIRLPDQLQASSMATCLDVAVLAAACLEQAGLHPLVVFVEAHAFAGVWLSDESFAEPAIADGVRLRKRVDLRDIEVFDPTGVTARPALLFEEAVDESRRMLLNADQFRYAIDIHRSRASQIRPLPALADVADAASDGADIGAGTPVRPDLAREPVITTVGPDKAGESPATRIDRWQRRLLDLTLRNRLLNFKETKKTLQVMAPDLVRLEDRLAADAPFQIQPRPRDFESGTPRDAAAYGRRTRTNAGDQVLLDALDAGRLHVDLSPDELERRLIETYRAARLALEEGGSSALYLAVGFLRWYETGTSEKAHLAPILLVPLELHRSANGRTFSAKQGDDEPRINVTLLEFLRQIHQIQLPSLDPLPEDQQGVDVEKVLNTVRRAVRDMDRWEVVAQAQIGFFSFTKFLMWRDLKERLAALLQNPVVAHLVNTPHLEFDAGGPFPDPAGLDEELAPVSTFCPLPADSSQLAAVIAAAQGRSFVLEGPPGTGKSQTITNLIAHCLTEGKTVLFVSEKMAALNVVHSRLSKVGLRRYCLELHSNKAHKQGVIAQLGESLRRVEEHDETAFTWQANQLAGLRKELNDYASALHSRRPSGESVFQATSRLIGLRDAPRVGLKWSGPDVIDAGYLAKLRDVAGRLSTAAAAVGALPGHPWTGVRKHLWTPGWEDELHASVATLTERTVQLSQGIGRVAQILGLEAHALTADQLSLINALTAHLMTSQGPPTALLVRPDWEEIETEIAAWLMHGKARDAIRTDLRRTFTDDVSALDVTALKQQCLAALNSSFLLRWWRLRPVKKAFAKVAVSGVSPEAQALVGHIDRVLELRREQGHLGSASDRARDLLGRYWKDGEADWQTIEDVRGWARELRRLASAMASGDPVRAGELRARWAQLATEGRADLAADASVGKDFLAFRAACLAFESAKSELQAVADLDAESLWGGATTPALLGRVTASLAKWKGPARGLRAWCAWRRERDEAMALGLAPVVAELESGNLFPRDVERVFERSYTQWWVNAVTDREPALSQFSSPQHDRTIEKFRQTDDKYMAYTQAVIQSRLAARLPVATTASLPGSEVGIIQREVTKKRGHLPVRQLFQKIPNLLPRLKPCLLMSPMSVAQYLDASYPPFDIVVFDEASQIPVWDAVGAIARGKQAVIVGDPRQLPPTSFFQTADDDEADVDEGVEDLESILDDCIGARISWLPLDWHYRSRHESLITFSNRNYYGNRLLTFPSAIMDGMGVSWRHVPGGVYDKGHTRTNRAEADAVVAEIVRRLKSPSQASESIGVVTFSQAQQTLVEDLLDVERGRDPEVERHFAEDADEPVFVKNLENVQGDERDVILFSICYGPDAQGRVSMNFGPMNRAGGERRLNVAITRARKEVIVFSTLRGDQIDLARSRARGIADLRTFLEYAERGVSALASAPGLDPEADFDSPFEEMVHDALVRLGWEVHKQVGTARYRIDLAIVDPERRGRYLIGVECDGANYHRAKTARDRDKLREAVLRDLGWELHRIWSTDWWNDQEREITKLGEAIDRARGRAASPPSVQPSPRVKTAEPVPPEPIQVDEPPFARSGPALQVYQPTPTGRILGATADFYSPTADAQVRRRIEEVVRREGPILLDLAARRVADSWGFGRVTEQAVQRVRSALRSADVIVLGPPSERVLWPNGVDPTTYHGFRVPAADGTGARDADELPLEEIGNAAMHLLQNHMSAPLDELVKGTATLFGFARVGANVEARMRKGIAKLVKSGRVKADGAMIALAP